MINFAIGSKVDLLVSKVGLGRGRKWVEKQGTVIDKNDRMILVKHENYKESYLLKDFTNGIVKIKG